MTYLWNNLKCQVIVMHCGFYCQRKMEMLSVHVVEQHLSTLYNIKKLFMLINNSTHSTTYLCCLFLKHTLFITNLSSAAQSSAVWMMLIYLGFMQLWHWHGFSCSTLQNGFVMSCYCRLYVVTLDMSGSACFISGRINVIMIFCSILWLILKSRNSALSHQWFARQSRLGYMSLLSSTLYKVIVHSEAQTSNKAKTRSDWLP